MSEPTRNTFPVPAPAARRQVRHALTALAAASPGRRRLIRQHAAAYLAQCERRVLPVGYDRPIPSDRANRVDAFQLRGGAEMARMLGIAAPPHDERLPATARAVIAAVDAPTDRLVALAAATGQPVAVALLHMADTATAATGIEVAA